MTDYVSNELRRIIGMIPTVDPTTTEYHILLQSLECFAGIADSIEEIMEQVGEPDAEDGTIVHVEFRPPADNGEEPKKVEAIPFKEFMERDIPKPEGYDEQYKDEVPEPVAEQTEPARVWEMAEVRAALVEARKKGVNVSALLREFGVENFGAFPAGKYDELMKRLEG